MPCAECSFKVWEEINETTEQKEAADAALQLENEEALCKVEEKMGKTLEQWIIDKKARREALPKG